MTRLLPWFIVLAGCRDAAQARVQEAPSGAAERTVMAEVRDASTDAPDAPDASAAQAGSDLGAEAELLLPLAARSQAPSSPPSGWCGETAIQEGLLHLGVWAPQALIHRAGRPAHEDLYSDEIPVALGELGVRFATYVGPRGYAPFLAWTKEALRAGDPVLAGVKILPTAHPSWGLDHFVLVVGYGPKGLLVNTTWGHRAWVSDTETPGLSLKNAFYGLRLQGLVLGPNAAAARLTFREETDTGVKVRVTCPTLTNGSIERRATRSERRAAWTHKGVDVELLLPSDEPARFQCVR